MSAGQNSPELSRLIHFDAYANGRNLMNVDRSMRSSVGKSETRRTVRLWADVHYAARGGRFGNGADLGELLRDLAQTGTLMSTSVADQLWDPAIAVDADILDGCWEYGRGFFVRGNWIAMAGGTSGSMAIAMHNWQQDFTVVMLTNMFGNALGEFANPILTEIGGDDDEFECVDAERFPEDECGVGCN